MEATANKGTLVVRSVLKSSGASSRNNRLRAQELAWNWVGARWPRLLPPPADRERPHLERRLPGRSLSVATSGDGLVWTLGVAFTERDNPRTWHTQATVINAGDADIIGLETTCTGAAAGPLVVAPPKLLGAWVENLALDDGGIPVLAEPRMVEDEEQLAAFCGQLLSGTRALPVIALANKPGSRYYGVDPRGLAEAVRGLAHVTCISPPLVHMLARRLTRRLAPVQGAARIYGAGFTEDAGGAAHPVVRDPAKAEAGADQGGFRRLLCRRICAMSTAA